jgi:hypothetical protein
MILDPEPFDLEFVRAHAQTLGGREVLAEILAEADDLRGETQRS